MPLLNRRSMLNLLTVADNEDLPRPNSTSGLDVAQPSAPRPVSSYGYPTSRSSHDLRGETVPDPTKPDSDRTRRFSLLKFRNYSESHLAARARLDAARQGRPPLPSASPLAEDATPAIVRTAPTLEPAEPEESTIDAGTERKFRPSLFRRSLSKSKISDVREQRKSAEHHRGERTKSSSMKWRKAQRQSTGVEDLARLSNTNSKAGSDSAPPSYGDESNSALALPVSDPRISESDGSNASSGDQIYGQTTTTTHTVSTHTTFFKLPRRSKNRNSLFPLPAKLPLPEEQHLTIDTPATPRASTSAYSTRSLRAPGERRSPGGLLQRRHTENSPTKQRAPPPPLPSPHAALAKSGVSFGEPGMTLGRNESLRSRDSSNSSPLRPPQRLGVRDRASTTSSFGRGSQDIDMPPPLTSSTRNSTSTTGRSSLGGFLTLSRFRQGSNPESPRHSSPGTRSKSNSFAISREALVIPEREEGDTPSKYLERLEAAVARSMIAGILSKSADPFAQAVLRSYTRRFPFFGEPIDMSLRKFLLEAELPKETQQVDRVIQAFADRYHECNPGIFKSPDQAYVLAFSLMMLHTDAFNKNNKRKMQKQDYIKNTSGQNVADEVLACFYDNICYTPFVHYEEEVDINGERVMPFKPKKSKLKGAIIETAGKKPTGPVDPYNLLVEQKLDHLRPPVKDCITFEDPYNYRATQAELNPEYLQRAFTHTGILQIISARSRPTAYEGQLSNNAASSAEPQAGIIDLKITKVGTLWRKATKKKKTRSPWQEWGAILTGSQLYLFRNAHWAKGLLAQFSAQQRYGQPRIPVIFKPPLTDFKPDALIKTDNAVALTDTTYTRHKHAFTFFRAGGQEEVLLAESESELQDWIALINYAAAFRAAGVRIRGMVGGNEEDLRRRDVQRLNSSQSTRSLQTAGGDIAAARGGFSPQLQRQVMAARRQIMVQKIAETEKEIVEAHKRLDDMIRDARHLLVLAPIAQKSREDVLHAAARSDAMIKWLRREIWRMTCHRDILTMDVQQDGVSAAELHALTHQQSAVSESARKNRQAALVRMESKAITEAAQSPPLSPTSPARSSRKSTRQSTGGSMDTFANNDVFITPPESATEQKAADPYRLPPLQLDMQARNEHRASVTSTLLSVSSPANRSLSQASSVSSVSRLDRYESERRSETSAQKAGFTPIATPSIEEREVEMLARSSITPDTAVPSAPAALNLDGTPPSATSEHKHKGVRRSLQKTLRDPHHPASTHKHHRRGKDSDGTVRSASGELEEVQEGTPGLQREKGRFILHGKQASVIQFGDEWPNERMRLRREQWRQNSGSPKEELTPRQANTAVTTPTTDTPSTAREGLDFGEDVSDDGTSSLSTAPSYTFREDAEAAEAYATSASPEQLSSTDSLAEPITPFDLAKFESVVGNRQTIIGPRSGASSSLIKGEDGMVESDVDDYSLGSKDNRRTVIGPPPPPLARAQTSVRAPAAEELSAESGAKVEENTEDDSMISAPVGDDQLRRRSYQAPAVHA
ncbi:hypothetical protein BAUCODRAFT_31018 [Baudoinia panamericana UAMH 10762]|uniref:SEC7 domain-containing protein n=1 Tax=Baudoinia panamericana (strain UAMH 10762) TaxID=717646 RepID=M2N430_BAUPA|nr:uncharacterized protein BAUCODRAFT_31018 [Baudoinia panamericana UAMH 10762]EMC98743.1 hypothetical protein BAUCODRAFT_31018 [Baudoinia panamericana UAMH 10762]